jgi:hypothetical protein
MWPSDTTLDVRELSPFVKRGLLMRIGNYPFSCYIALGQLWPSDTTLVVHELSS